MVKGSGHLYSATGNALYFLGGTTPPKTNMEPEKDGLQKDGPFLGGPFSRSMLVFGELHVYLVGQSKRLNFLCHHPWAE